MVPLYVFALIWYWYIKKIDILAGFYRVGDLHEFQSIPLLFDLTSLLYCSYNLLFQSIEINCQMLNISGMTTIPLYWILSSKIHELVIFNAWSLAMGTCVLTLIIIYGPFLYRSAICFEMPRCLIPSRFNIMTLCPLGWHCISLKCMRLNKDVNVLALYNHISLTLPNNCFPLQGKRSLR